MEIIQMESLSNMQLHNLDLFKEELPGCFGEADYFFAQNPRQIDSANYLKQIVTDVKLPKSEIETAIREYLYDCDIMSNLQNILTYTAIDFFYDQRYEIDIPSGFEEEDLQTFLNLLILQGKIIKPTIEKIKRCRYLAFCMVDNKVVSIGAIKPITVSVFGKEKADIPGYAKQIDGELGYCFTIEEFQGKGYGSNIVRRLLTHVDQQNLMATTELSETNHMMIILKNGDFARFGKSFKSRKHKGELGLFLRMVEKQEIPDFPE